MSNFSVPTRDAPMAAEDVALQFYPSFVRAIYADDKPWLVIGFDGWAVSSVGSWEDDYRQGAFFAELAICFARDMGEGFLRFVLATMVHKGRFGPTEDGFIDRIARAARAGSLN